MKLKKIKVTNFCSYPSLTLNLSKPGLTLLHGPTGSGKSTVLDAIPWCLFGETAKNVGVDDIKSWANVELPTTGEIHVELPNGSIVIHRTRKKGSNDLYWVEATSPDVIKRGKDNNDTQKLINARLGISSQLYFSAAYFSEFSSISSFFVSKAKDRRAVFDQIANLEFPARVVEVAAATKKVSKNALMELEKDLAKSLGSVAQLKSMIEDLEDRIEKWDVAHQNKISKIFAQIDTYSKNKETVSADLVGQCIKLESEIIPNEDFEKEVRYLTSKIHSLDKNTVCIHCNSTLSNKEHLEYEKTLSNIKSAQIKNNQKISKLVQLKQEVEKRDSLKVQYLKELDELQEQTNPFADQSSRMNLGLTAGYKKIAEQKEIKARLQQELADLEVLYELSFELRSELLRKAIEDIQDKTNTHLEDHFNGDLRVSLILTNTDDLDVEITKNGYNCSYSQLSKGQRQMLKLCFSVSVMEASANANGIHFSNLFFDEALDGFDSELKLKAFNLFEQLQSNHEAIIVIDHSEELKTMFHNKLKVSTTGDTSILETDDA